MTCVSGRLAYCFGVRGKPSIAVTAGWDIYLGNEGNAKLEFVGCKLLGFNLGQFEEKLVEGWAWVCVSLYDELTCLFLLLLLAGAGDSETKGIPWRLTNDLSYVSLDKKLYPFCGLLHHCVTQRGLAEVDVQDHIISARLHEAAASFILPGNMSLVEW